MLDPRRTKVTKQLSYVGVDKQAARLYFYDQALLYEKIRVVIAKNRSIFIDDLQRKLLFHSQSQFSQPVR